jgi:hypothetical protein
MRARSFLALPLSLLLLTACATTGATYRSGVGDAFPEKTPYYAGAASTPAGTADARVGVLPVHFQPSGGEASLFDPSWGASSPISLLLREMNGFLDSLRTSAGARTTRLVTGLSADRSFPLDLKLGVAPDVRFGCLTELDLPGEDCAARGDSALGRGRQTMKLAVGRPDARWVSWVGRTMDASGSTHAIVITLEVGQYLMKQRGLAGRKIVELGTGYEVELPWMTSLETPVTVLQLTAALMDRKGQAVRIGAEGIAAKRTPLLASAVGAQRMLSDADIELIRNTRRTDLPGQPLAWQEAMKQLVRQLTP